MRHVTQFLSMISLLALLGTAPAGAEQVENRLGSVLGREVITQAEGDGGRIVDVLVDGEGRIRAAVVEFGGYLGIGTRKIAVDWSAFRFADPLITVSVSRDQLRTASEFKANAPPVVVRPIEK